MPSHTRYSLVLQNLRHHESLPQSHIENWFTKVHFNIILRSMCQSPDLTPCDYFLWGYLKTKVFETKPRNIADLKQRIQHEVAAIPVEMLREAMNSFRSRLEECVRRTGSHLEGVIFKKINFQTGIKQNGYSYAFHL